MAASKQIIKFPISKQNVHRNKALTNGAPTVIKGFPIGEGWYTLWLNFVFTLDANTGTGVVAEGLLRMIKNIMLKVPIDGLIVNAPGRFLYRRAQKVMGTLPYIDTLAITDGTYRVSIPIHFANRRFRRIEDTILNTGRYNADSIELTVSLGTIADLATTPNDASVSVTVDIDVEKSKYALSEANGNMPLALPYIAALPPVDPNSQTFIEVEKSADLILLDLMVATTNTDVTGGLIYSGTGSNAVVDDLSILDSEGMPFMNVPFHSLRFDNKLKFQLETALTGLVVMDFAEDYSVFSGYATGAQSQCQIRWTPGTLTGAQISALMDGYKMLR